jgi:phage portal protein BeeE
MSAFIWKELIVSNLMLAGDHFSVIEYDNAARVVGLLPVVPQQTEVRRVNGRNRYVFRFTDGAEELDQEDVVHVPGIGFDGVRGISPIQWAGRQPIGTAFALEEFVGRMHRQQRATVRRHGSAGEDVG